MNSFPEIGTFDVLSPGSDFGQLQSENAKLSNERLILMIVLTAVVVGGVIYVANQNRQMNVIKANFAQQEKPTF
jgi:hypothetical protein